MFVAQGKRLAHQVRPVFAGRRRVNPDRLTSDSQVVVCPQDRVKTVFTVRKVCPWATGQGHRA